ncbi:MAG: dienelactone hydrolase family protein [Beijerinckiaceae bacterium]
MSVLLGQSVSAQERIEIDVADGKPLLAMVYRPAGAGPFPAVVAMHGCGGLNGSNGLPSARHDDWGKVLSSKGYMVVFPDSYGSRGLGSQCLVKDRTVRPGRERVGDALAAKAWLQQQSSVKADRISLLGWSNGGSSVLWSVSSDKKPRDGKPDFKSAIAFYPGCRLLAQSAERRDWENRLPLLILIGEADTWTPSGPCKQLVASMVGLGRKASIITYDKALHEFDHPNRQLTKRTGLAFTSDDSGEAMVGTDPTAREDALIRVPAFLDQ